ncbi:MAG: glycosyltransferase family 1 protein [Alphaproteobacteria bacterium]|nr:glycosyltransferase family 1 protein [Alphaproteobacteria bacterium]
MKLLIVSDAWFPQVNGVVRTYEHLSEELRKHNHEVRVIGPADFWFRIPMPGYPEIKLALAPYRALSRKIETYNPDNIHIPTEGPLGWAARKYCLKHNRRFSTSFHTRFPDYVARRVDQYLPFLHNTAHKMGQAYVRTFHAPSSAMMVSTPSMEETLREWGFKNPANRVSRGADLDLFYPGEKMLFKELPRPVALYVGRIAIEKSIEDFLEMPWAGSKVIVGDGPSRQSLEKKYPEAIFTGTKTDQELAAHYRSADIFIFPSRTDTFGMVLLEALAAGLPIAGYNVTGPKDIITENFLGALHDTDLSIAAQKALHCGTPEQRSIYVKSSYSWENAARQYERALLNITRHSS